MNDCPSGDVRDLLPDLLHERLDDETRAVVESHLLTCADCRAEFALLGDLRATLRRTPAIDVASIVAAIPAYRAPVRRSWAGWKTAAAITVLVAGGSSIAVLQRAPVAVDSARVTAAATPETPVLASQADPSLAAGVEASPVVASASPKAGALAVKTPAPEAAAPAQGATPAGRELAMGGGSLTDLNDRELSSLLKAIESLDALPSADVEHVIVSPMGPGRP